jgi:hypothetical protein
MGGIESGGCHIEDDEGGGQQRLVLELVKGPTCVQYCICINTFKLANYCSLDALPASRSDLGDVDKLE